SLSGVEPLFSVTRYYHGRRITYHRKLIRQTLERYIASTRTVRLAKLFRFTKRRAETRLVFILINALVPSRVRAFMHVLALELPQLSKYDNDILVNSGCCNELFAASPYLGVCLDMHGLIFETSI